MPGWTDDGDNRWRYNDDPRHLLLRVGDRLVEAHGTFVHIYAAETVDLGNPLGAATWVSTAEHPELADAAPDALWQAMAEAAAPEPPA